MLSPPVLQTNRIRVRRPAGDGVGHRGRCCHLPGVLAVGAVCGAVRRR